MTILRLIACEGMLAAELTYLHRMLYTADHTKERVFILNQKICCELHS